MEITDTKMAMGLVVNFRIKILNNDKVREEKLSVSLIGVKH